MRVLGSVVVVCGAWSNVASAVPPGKVLFDATKAEMAGNADWVIDADVHNVGTGSGGAMVVGGGSDSNPQRFPYPPASGITSSTAETYWTGALSSWGVALVKRGFQVETLPIGGRITFGDSTNAQDLSNYGIYVIDEPNIRFSSAEKTAIIQFVNAGGGLFIISDHAGSDRNGDGIDSVGVLTDLVTNNGISSNVFGITFNSQNLVVTTSYVSTAANDPLIHGAAGDVSQMQYNNGTTLAIAGPNAHGAIWHTSARLNNDLFVAYATYGQGKVVACGDSSPFDDGTGDTGDTLYNGWSAEVNGDHAKLAINACLWLNPSVACPVVNAPLASMIVCPQDPASFSVSASGGGTLTYQWRHNSVAIPAAQNPSAITATLTVAATTLGRGGTYDCIVSNSCGSVTSSPAVLTTCPVDFNCDGFVDFYDYTDFVTCFEGTACPPGVTADFNGDDFIDFYDFTDFVTAFSIGC